MAEADLITVPDASWRALISASSPILFDEATHEPYIPLPTSPRRSTEYILTPPRLSDSPDHVACFNSPAVRDWLFSAPNPFTTEHSLEWLKRERKEHTKILEEWELGKVPLGVPVSVVRERESQRFAGNISLRRESRFTHIEDLEERQKMCELNAERQAGDPDIVWTIGFVLVTEHAGKGVMTDAVDVMMHKMLAQVVKGTFIHSACFVGNEGSRAVHRKLGFAETGMETVRMREDRGGQLRDSWLFEWRAPRE